MKIEDINFTLPTAEIFENKICTIFARFGKNQPTRNIKNISFRSHARLLKSVD